MSKSNIIFVAALIMLCTAGTEAHEKKKTLVPGQAISAPHEGVKHTAMAGGEAVENPVTQNTRNSEEEDGMALILLFGGLTAMSLMVTAFFSIFRVPVGWMKWHKISAYITLGLMFVHGSLAIYGHFFG